MRTPTKEQRVTAIIFISFSFLILELVIGFRNHSLALVADAFHVASDLIGFAVALVAIRMQSEKRKAPTRYSFGWQRAEILGGFFNGGAFKIACLAFRFRL
jgi:solute carrier family 30 (zinc transporter), member 1